jgi:uncharacterized protein (DUF1330 family)
VISHAHKNRRRDIRPKGYWIARVDVHDAENYKKYIEANATVFAKFGAKFVIRSAPEGSARRATW